MTFWKRQNDEDINRSVVAREEQTGIYEERMDKQNADDSQGSKRIPCDGPSVMA